MSSWLLLATGSGAGGGGAGAGFGAGGAGFGAGAIADGGISFITAGFAAAGRAGQLFSSSRLGLVVGYDTTDRRQNLLHRGLLDLCRLRHLRLHIETILHQSHKGIAGSGYAGRDFHRTSPTCPQIKPARRIARRVLLPSKRPQRASMRCKDAGHESLSSPQKRYVMATIDCKQSARRFRRRATISSRLCGNVLDNISGRRVCERRPSYRAPDDSARSDHRPWSAG